jgi:hypothetical protein
VPDAEVIDGPANIRDVPNGRALFSLNDKVIVESEKSINEWFTIALPVYVEVNASFVDEEKTVLKKGVKLYNKEGLIIGVTLERVGASPFYDESVVNQRIGVVLKGVTHGQNIRRDSILELQLAATLDARETPSLDDFRYILKSFHFTEWMPHEKFIPYIQFDEVTSDPSPWPRAILFFRDGKLVAIYHSKSIPSDKLILSEKIRDSTISYVGGLTPEIRMKLSDIYYPIIKNAN